MTVPATKFPGDTTILAADAVDGTIVAGGLTVQNHKIIDGEVFFDLVAADGWLVGKVSGKIENVLLSLPEN